MIILIEAHQNPKPENGDPRDGKPVVAAGGSVSRPSRKTPAEPLYQKVYFSILADLDANRWAPGEAMPTERVLAETFDCSLITVRRALDELSREHRIVRKRGLGTFASVPPVDRDLTVLSSFTDEMNQRGLASKSVVVSLALIEATPAAAQGLGIPVGSAVYRLVRVRYAADSPLLIEDVELPAQLFPGLMEKDVENRSLYDIFATDYGFHIDHARETVEATLPTKREASLLEQQADQPVLLIQLVAYAESGEAVEFCRSLVRGDRARYHHETHKNKTSLSLVVGGLAPRVNRTHKTGEAAQ